MSYFRGVLTPRTVRPALCGLGQIGSRFALLVFAAAKEQLQKNRRLTQKHGRGQRYLLQGLVVCARCSYAFYGKPVSRSTAKGRRQYVYYRCTGTDGYRFAGGRICDNAQVRADQLDGHVWESVRDLLKDPARLEQEWSRRGEADGGRTELRNQRDEAARLLANGERTMRLSLLKTRPASKIGGFRPSPPA